MKLMIYFIILTYMLVYCYSLDQIIFSENNLEYKKYTISYKENDNYKLLKMISGEKEIRSPIIYSFYEKTSDWVISGPPIYDSKDEDISFKRSDYGYPNKLLIYLYDLADELNINDFIIEKLDIDDKYDIEYLIELEIKMRNSYFNSSSLDRFIKSQMFMQLCLTLIYRKDIYKYKEDIFLHLKKIEKPKSDYIHEIINFNNILESERILKDIINYDNNKSVIPSDLFWALNIQEERILSRISDDEDELIKNNSLLKSYINIKYDNNIFDYGEKSNKNLKTIKIINISKNVIINNLFKHNNTILKHFKLILLDKRQGKHLMNYLINTLSYEKIKEIYIENCTIKNSFIESIIDIYLSNIIYQKSGPIKDISFSDVLFDEDTNIIYLK